MKNDLLQKKVSKLGLNDNQSMVYLSLLKNGMSKAGRIPGYTGLKRGLCYKTLDQLVELGFVKKHGENTKITFYSPLSPDKLYDHISMEKKRVYELENDFNDISGILKSQFNILSGKTNVRYFEGEKEVEEMLNDSLETQGAMYTYGDVDMIEQNYKDLNNRHSEKRKLNNIMKKILLTKSKLALKILKQSKNDPLTEIRIIDKDYAPVKSVIEIYDNKISYITISKIGMSGILIEDKQIAQMHKFLFEALWEKSLQSK